MKISTIAVHGGLTDTSHYAAAFPVYLTSTFIQKGPTEFREYGYSRTANPTRSDVESMLPTLRAPSTASPLPPAWPRFRWSLKRSMPATAC